MSAGPQSNFWHDLIALSANVANYCCSLFEFYDDIIWPYFSSLAQEKQRDFLRSIL